MMYVGILVVGFVLLVLGANQFVDGTSALAEKLGIPSLIIGLTVVAFGTSAPELAVSITASLQQANEIVIGNVIGSNIFNLLMVVGISAILHPLVAEEDLLKRDWVFSILATIVLGMMIFWGQSISIIDGFILLIFFIGIMSIQSYSAVKSKKNNEINHVEEKNVITNQTNLLIAGKITVGLAAIIIGGQYAVNGATEIARMLSISETVIGLTVVAIGTSLPELVTSIVATRKGEYSIAIGNVIGSNIFNTVFILGVSAICNPITVASTAMYDTLLLLLISILYFIPAKCKRFGRKCGISMVGLYIIYTIWIIIR